MRASPRTGITRQIGSVGVGLAVLGLASFAFLSISGRALGPEAFAPLGTLWILVNAAGPALFQPLEQELGRGIAHARAMGTGARPLFLRGVALALTVVGILGVGLAAAHDQLAERLFNGEDVLVIALFVGLAGLAAEGVSRGAFAGSGAFGRYGWQLGLDGLLRLGGSVALFVAGVSLVGWYGLVLGVAPVLAALLTMGSVGPALTHGEPERWSRLTHALGLLTAGGLLQQLVINAPGVAANLIAGTADQARAGIFISVLVLARIPLFLFTAIQAAFLPTLAALAARDDRSGFHRQMRGVLMVVTGIGVAGILVVAAAGPQLVRLFYGDAYQTSRLLLVILAAGATLVMVGSALSQILISLRSYQASLVGWLCGSVTFLAALALPFSLEYRVGLAFLASTVAAAGALAIALQLRTRRPLNVDRTVPQGEPL